MKKNKKEIVPDTIIQLEPCQILADIIPERTIDFFSVANITCDIKDGKLVAEIDNMISDIKVSMDMRDIAKYYGYKKWDVVNVADIDYSDDGCILVDHKCYVTKVQFSERIKR